MRKLVSLLVLAAIFGVSHVSRAQEKGTAHRAALQPGDPRSHLDHRLHERKPRLHDLRHPVRHRREKPDQAADGGVVDGKPGSPPVDLQAAQGPRIPRRQAGHRRGRDRVPAALGQARRDGLGAVYLHRPHGHAHARHLPHLPARGLRFTLEGARQAFLQRAVHHAQARRRNRPVQQIEDYIGSGPYVFKKDEFKPGDKAVYTKFAKYIPRKEAPSGSAGGKVVYVDRVEWNLALRDAQAQVNALQKGEVDIIEALGFDSSRPRRRIRTSSCRKYQTVNFQYMARFNHLNKPFDNPKVRLAVLAAFAQQPFLQAQVGVKELYNTCPSMFTCGTPYRQRLRQRHPVQVQHEEGAGAAEGLGLRRHADRADEADRPRLDPEARQTSARSCCARTVSRWTCRQWTGRRWSAGARKRIRSTRAAGTCS